MEKRWSERKTLNLQAELHQRGEQPFECRTRNVSLGGTFLEINPPLPDMHKNDNVEVVFYLNPDGVATKHRLNARVVRLSDKGIGFKYFNFDTNAFRSLQEIMSYQDKL
jgi:hypothetical protein